MSWGHLNIGLKYNYDLCHVNVVFLCSSPGIPIKNLTVLKVQVLYFLYVIKISCVISTERSLSSSCIHLNWLQMALKSNLKLIKLWLLRTFAFWQGSCWEYKIKACFEKGGIQLSLVDVLLKTKYIFLKRSLPLHMEWKSLKRYWNKQVLRCVGRQRRD